MPRSCETEVLRVVALAADLLCSPYEVARARARGETSRGQGYRYGRRAASLLPPTAAARCRVGRRGRDALLHLRLGRSSRSSWSAAGALGPVTLAYETYGELRPDGGNAILACHALSGDAHAAGWSVDPDAPSAVDGMGADEKGIGPRGGLGWWDGMIGPGKAFDTTQVLRDLLERDRELPRLDRAGLDRPATGRPYGSRFPLVTVGDMVRGAARAAAAPRRRAAAGRGRRLARRQPGAPVGGRLPGDGRRLHRDRHLRQPERPGHRLERDRPPGDHGRPGLERRRLLRAGRSRARAGGGPDDRPRDLPERAVDDGEVRAPAPPRPTSRRWLRRRRRCSATSSARSRSRATCATRASGSSSGSTPTPTWRSAGRSTSSTWRRRSATARWSGRFRGRGRASWSSRLARTGCIRRTSRSGSWRRSRRHGREVTYRNLRSSYGHDAFLLEEGRQTSLIRPFLAKLREQASSKQASRR